MESSEYNQIFVKIGAVIISLWYFLLFYMFPTSYRIDFDTDGFSEGFGAFTLILIIFVLLYLIGSASIFISKLIGFIGDPLSKETEFKLEKSYVTMKLKDHYVFNIKRLVILTILVVYTDILTGIYEVNLLSSIGLLTAFFVTLFFADILINKLIIVNKTFLHYKWSFTSWVSFFVCLLMMVSLFGNFKEILANSFKIIEAVGNQKIILEILQKMGVESILFFLMIWVVFIWTCIKLAFEWKSIFNDFQRILSNLRALALKSMFKFKNIKLIIIKKVSYYSNK